MTPTVSSLTRIAGAGPSPKNDPVTNTLTSVLDQQRATVVRKLTGLSDRQARSRPVPTSTMTPMSLVRHLAAVERGGSAPTSPHCASRRRGPTVTLSGTGSSSVTTTRWRAASRCTSMSAPPPVRCSRRLAASTSPPSNRRTKRSTCGSPSPT
ncbi:DUF664 domain-containing protein [Georgenia yuyongxinii]|uniref:DUF664 domain-containing protein n=1 Tax=Georgenia yuyongxinii TaxID=2589797 RepID=A0A5B8C951_9MICO|nr:DUF664 domain-containing protein [Georgenia yuyongxinii]